MTLLSHIRWRCLRCGCFFEAFATAQRHVDVEHGGGRIELAWNGASGMNPHPGTGMKVDRLTAESEVEFLREELTRARQRIKILNDELDQADRALDTLRRAHADG